MSLTTSLLAPLYGPIFFGTILTSTFYGFTCMQTFFYYIHYRNDPSYIKSLVAVIWALNTIHEGLIVSGAYKYIMGGLLNPAFLSDGVPELIVQIVPTTLATFLSQGFLVYRIYRFGGNKIIAPVLWVTLGIVSLVSIIIYLTKALYTVNGVVYAVEISMLSQNPPLALATICLSAAAAEDVLIAFFMTLLLLHERNVTDFARTAHILQRLTVFTVNTGSLTATFALLTLILMHVYRSSTLYVVFLDPLCAVYCNTLLANLNARAYIAGTQGGTGVQMFGVTKKQSRVAGLLGTQMDIRKTTDVETFSDADHSILPLTGSHAGV